MASLVDVEGEVVEVSEGKKERVETKVFKCVTSRLSCLSAEEEIEVMESSSGRSCEEMAKSVETNEYI